MGQPRFTEDFKTDAIKQITERGHSISDVSQRLGVSTHSLYAWIKLRAGSPSAAVKDDQSAEIRRLKQELARVTEERDILKKATVGSTGQRNMFYFMRHGEAHNGKDRKTRFIATTKRRALATLERWTVAK